MKKNKTSLLKTGLLVPFFIFIFSSTTFSSQAIYPFDSEKKEQQFDRMIQQVRCLVCKNQNIAESNTPLAKDLRQKIYEQIEAEQSDAEIKTYLVERYGDFILFQPLLKSNTYFLWLGPIVFLTLAVLILFYVLHRRQEPH